ncbi:MAG: ATP-grasp domain-containing protein, partial [Actinomycetia bacterium]|nr:ATP-grasp domain-containing protein [Actinomycetes bacterium]
MARTLGNSDFIPLIFAADINVYSLARAFHEQYDIVSAGFGKADSGPIRHTRILQYQAVRGADQPTVLPGLIRDFARQHPDQQILVFGCGDNYVREISTAQAGYPENVVVPYLEYPALRQLANKQSFYALCDQYQLAHPATFFYQESMGGQLDLEFGPPYIVKPADTVSWWVYPFEGQRKVHLVPDLPSLKNLLSTIYAHGYADTMIIQEYIPGPDSQLHILTQYYDQQGELRLSCAGQVLLEEHTAFGIGNSAIIISENLPEVTAPGTALLQSQHYRGFAAFDIKYDSRDQRYKLLEVNTRQGRGNYYVTGSGLNLARFVTEDLIYERQLTPELRPPQPFLWQVTGLSVVRQCAADLGMQDRVEELIRAGRAGNP